MTIDELKLLTDEDIQNLSTLKKQEVMKMLSKEIDDADSRYNYNKAMQLGLKLVLNGTYGAFAHPKFIVSNKHIANAITKHGRDVILFMLQKIEKYFYDNWHLDTETHKLLSIKYIAHDDNDVWYMLNYKHEQIEWSHKSLAEVLRVWNIKFSGIEKIDEEKITTSDDKNLTICYKRFIHDFKHLRPLDKTVTRERDKMDGYDIDFHKESVIVYGDTDSVNAYTSISYEKGESTIEELYNKNIKNGSAGTTLKGHESIKCTEKVLNWTEDKKLYYAPVRRIIRHKVRKAKWKLKTKSGKEITITNDHSMIVFRNNKKIEVKPSEILKTDKILVVKK